MQRIIPIDLKPGHLHLDTDFGLVRVKPGQWVVKDSSGNLHILDPEEFHKRYEAASD
jgi:hypothetical protein